MKNNFSVNYSRRKFLQVSGAAFGAATLGFPAILSAQNTNSVLHVGCVGLGGQGRSRLSEVLGCGVKVVALCDVDSNQVQGAKDMISKDHPDVAVADITVYSDYRKMLSDQKDLDAVIIATPDHWHYHIAKASLLAGKHTFCEKPLAHAISQVRELRQLAAQTKLVTQMGNQGSATPNLRRGVELIQAGVLGKITEVKAWVGGAGLHPGRQLPKAHEADPVPANFNWDAWCGPAEVHPFKNGYYHPWDWRSWMDYGGGAIADFACHDFNLPMRALKLTYPTSISLKAELLGQPNYPKDVHLEYKFPARDDLPEVSLKWADQGAVGESASQLPPAVLERYGKDNVQGLLITGEKGYTFGDHWSGSEYIQLQGEDKLSGILNHAASKDVPATLPKSPGHMKEWVLACQGGPETFSPFEIGGHLTEIALVGILTARVGKNITWDGEAMTADATEADQYIHPTYRDTWIS